MTDPADNSREIPAPLISLELQERTARRLLAQGGHRVRAAAGPFTDPADDVTEVQLAELLDCAARMRPWFEQWRRARVALGEQRRDDRRQT